MVISCQYLLRLGGNDMNNQRYVKSPAILVLEQLAKENFKTKHPTFPENCYPKFKYKDNSSNDLTKCIIDFIIFKGGQAERISSAGRIIDTRKTFVDVIDCKRTIGKAKWIKPTSTNGTADISATIQGKAVKIEVKCRATGDRYQSQAQIQYQKAIEQAGGLYIIARDFEGFYSWYLKHFGHEEE